MLMHNQTPAGRFAFLANKLINSSVPWVKPSRSHAIPDGACCCASNSLAFAKATSWRIFDTLSGPATSNAFNASLPSSKFNVRLCKHNRLLWRCVKSKSAHPFKQDVDHTTMVFSRCTRRLCSGSACPMAVSIRSCSLRHSIAASLISSSCAP